MKTKNKRFKALFQNSKSRWRHERKTFLQLKITTNMTIFEPNRNILTIYDCKLKFFMDTNCLFENTLNENYMRVQSLVQIIALYVCMFSYKKLKFIIVWQLNLKNKTILYQN